MVLSLPPHCWDRKCETPCLPLLHGCWGLNMVLIFASQALYQLRCLSSLLPWEFKWGLLDHSLCCLCRYPWFSSFLFSTCADGPIQALAMCSTGKGLPPWAPLRHTSLCIIYTVYLLEDGFGESLSNALEGYLRLIVPEFHGPKYPKLKLDWLPFPTDSHFRGEAQSEQGLV